MRSRRRSVLSWPRLGRCPRLHADPLTRRLAQRLRWQAMPGSADRARSDDSLAERVAHGDLAAFEALYDRYVREVHALAAHVLGRAAAEEAVQDIFLRLWERAGQFEPRRGSFGGWFMSLARHRVIDEIRRRRVQEIPFADIEEL